ncbi:MAG: ribonuclease D [Candidatus Rokubacteria bacterium]|nr:ribonuclease D [Candidatus Rokubacteria bacterium]
MRRLAVAPEIAVDTEGDSLHHYPARLALVQVAEPSGEVTLVDPLAVDLAPLGRVFADPGVVLVLHAGDNDLAEFKARYGFTFASVFDTAIAARFLGVRTLGLDALLTSWLGVLLPPSRQKDDWSARPLSPEQETYAAADVQHLFALRARLTEELVGRGRLAWVEEECAALAAQPPPDRSPDPNAFLRVKGARDLPPRILAILRELHETRERLARAADRPPFKVLGDEALLRIALTMPGDLEQLGGVPGCTPRVVGRWGGALLDAIARGRALPESSLPVRDRPRRPAGSAALARRSELLKRWRTQAAERYDLDPGALLPNRLIAQLAETAPRTRAALEGVEGLRRWRVETFGHELLAVLESAHSPSRGG